MADPRSEWPSEYAAAALLLLKAADFAESERRRNWDFAVEIEDLQRLGLSRADLRWLVCRGWLEHAADVSAASGGERVFRSTGRLTFHDDSCFVLTAAGRAAANQLTSTKLPPARPEAERSGEGTHVEASSPHRNGKANGENGKQNGNGNGNCGSIGAHGIGHNHSGVLKPLWNPDLNRLTLGNLIVKEYRTPAPNQQLILSAFQEENWPHRIDDPLPPHPELDAKRRLHETIISLNRNQKNRTLRFSGDGNGLGIRWQAILSHLG